LLCLGTPTVAQETGTDDSCTEPLTIIENVRVFDGLEVIPEATVVIRCTLIDSVTRGNEAAARPAGSVVVDGRDKTLLPGLIDSHTHTFRRSMLERSLDFGVTTVFDMGSLALSFKAEMDAEVAQGAIRDRADMRGPVLWATAPGSHGTQFGDAPTLANPDDADEFVDRLIADGADYIKVIYDLMLRIGMALWPWFIHATSTPMRMRPRPARMDSFTYRWMKCQVPILFRCCMKRGFLSARICRG
jgi:hypothetical protein